MKDINIDINDGILPYTIWDDLADSEVLIEYYRKYIKDNKNEYSRLNKIMFGALYMYSSEVMPELEEYFGEKYINSIQLFLTKVEKCRNRMQ